MADEQVAQGTGISIDWCAADRVPVLQSLIDSHWRKGHILARDGALLRWQYRHPSDPERLSVLLAEHNGDPVGMMGLIPCGFCVRGARVPGAWLAMWLTVPEWRPRRLGLRLLRQLFTRDYGMVGVLGVNQETTGAIYKALGFAAFDVVPRWVRITSPEALANLVADNADRYSPAARAGWAAAARRGLTAAPAPARLAGWNPETAARWDQAWHEQFAPRLVGTWRDAAYLRWRYVDHPRYQYQLRFIESPSGGALEGLLVSRIEKVRDRGESVLRVVEFLSTASVGAALARVVLDEGEAAQVAFTDFFCTSAAVAPYLEGAGFVREEAMQAPLPSRFQPLDFNHTRLNGVFWIRPDIAGDSQAFFDTPAFYVTRADGDQDRPS